MMLKAKQNRNKQKRIHWSPLEVATEVATAPYYYLKIFQRKESSIYPAFPVWTVYQSKQIVDQEKFF